MSRGIYVALSGAVAEEKALETTANNLANSSTSGFQRERTVFREALGAATRGDKTIHRVAMSETSIDTSQGALRSTGNPLDLALGAKEYIAVETPNGERYTRAASLRIDNTGTLRTASGDAVLGETRKPIVVSPRETIRVSSDGQVMQGTQALGRLRVVTFTDPRQLAHEGASRLAETPGSGKPTATPPHVESGFVEESNAAAVSGMTELMTQTRSFDAFAKAIEILRDIDRAAATRLPST